MRRFIRLALVAGVLLPLAISKPATAADNAALFPPVSKNAALQYWQAFAMLPALDDAQEKLLDNRATAPLDDAVTKLLNESHASLLFLHRGAKLRECEWGLDYRDGAQMFLPHLNKARTLAQLAALDARRAFEAGQFDRARDDAFGMAAMARQCGKDHTLVSMLVCYMIEEMTVDAVAPHLPKLKASYQDAVAGFESLPPSPRLAHGVQCERRLTSTIIEQLKEGEQRQPGSWRSDWRSMLGEGVGNPAGKVESFEELLKLFADFQEAYDELAQLTTLPWQEFDAKYPEFAKRAETASPLAKLLLPAMDKVVKAQRHAEARMAMLLAGVAVAEGGQEKLADIKDPFGDGPFGYRKLDGDAFELSSKLTQDGKPVTLVIGRKSE